MKIYLCVGCVLGVASLVVAGCAGQEGGGEPGADVPAAEEGDDVVDAGAETTTVPDEDAVAVVDTSAPDDAGIEEPPPGPPSEPPPIAGTYETFIGDWTLAPGEEVTRCALKRLDNDEVVWVTAIHSTLAKGSHHMIVYATDEDEEMLDPQECTPFTETLSGQAYPLIITQVPEETMAMPPGVAVRFEPHQMIRLEAHYLNYYPEEVVAHGDVIFDTIAEEDVWAEANMLFYGNVDFELAPQETTSTPWAFLPVADGVEVFALTGHTHRYGVNVEIEHALGPDDLSYEVYPLDQTFHWDESPVLQYDPPLRFHGTDGFRFRCTWENPSDSAVGFGEGATDEMCFLWAYYYPSSGYRICVETGSLLADFAALIGGTAICCPENPICDLAPGLVEGLF